ncbi:MAG TPA: hypothetical protein VMV18_04090 [bacterium]|nr:hypothetical protein [bacterium]
MKTSGIFIVVLAAAGAIGCHARKRLLFESNETSISVTLDFPLDPITQAEGSFSTTCRSAKALLISIGSSATWDVRLLAGTDGSLFGCAGGACPTQSIAQNVGVPSRVLVEGIDVDPVSYASTSTINVICRGEANASVGMGSFAVTVPPPGPSRPDPAQVLVHIPMLRISDTNGTFAPGGPAAFEGRLAGFGISARSNSGGTLIFAGGESLAGAPSATLYAFSPTAISFAKLPFEMQEGRYMPCVSSFVDSAGLPALAVIGGETAASDSHDAEIVRPGRQGTQLLPTLASLPSKFCAAAFDLAHREAGAPSPIVVVVGGQVGATYNSSYQFLYAAAPQDLTGCAAGASTGRAAFCRPFPSTLFSGGQTIPLAGTLSAPNGLRVWSGLGYGPGGISPESVLFDPDTQQVSAPLQFPFVGAELAGVANISTTELGVFGGENSAVLSTNWSFVRGGDGVFVRGLNPMHVAHFDGPAVQLSDGRVLLPGGHSDAALGRVFELFDPGAITSAGTFTLISSVPGVSCVDGLSFPCASSPGRLFGATAARIDGTTTWLNGSVVIGGAFLDPAPTVLFPQIYVPAYECNGITPVDRTGTAMTSVDFCDRSRSTQPITDPSNPVPLSN